MRRLARQLLALALCFVLIGGTAGIAYAFGADPCDDAASSAEAGYGDQDHHAHDTTERSCLGCPCCAAVPILPGASLALDAPQHIDYVAYDEISRLLTGRLVAPDLAPPKSPI